MEKRIIIALQVITIALVAYFGITMSQYKSAEKEITKFNLDSCSEVWVEQGADFYLDQATYKVSGEKMIDINGWCAIKGTNSAGANIQVLLREKIANPNATAECYKLKTKAIFRYGITAIFHNGTNYDHSGFSASVGGKDLDLEHMKYEIWLLYSIGGRQYVINTGRVLEPAKK